MSIFVIDSRDVAHPEDLAMLQALYSRSPALVHEHMEKVKKAGSGAFMEKYYVGYNHASIADCGSTTIFIEDVSMLAAKAFQDWALYSGQEASTRYMDFSKARIEDPVGTLDSRAIQERWMMFYHAAREPLLSHLIQKYPRSDDGEAKYEGAIKARAFDILRAFLPAGASTNLSWHTNLRQAADKLRWMIWHPDATIARTAQKVADCLDHKYKHSGFGKLDKDLAANTYYRTTMAEHAYTDEAGSAPGYPMSGTVFYEDSLDTESMRRYRGLFESRPLRAPLPAFLEYLGQIRTRFGLDFGSFRDLQRHRNGVVRMPLLKPRGFHPWYFEQLPTSLMEDAVALVGQQSKAIAALQVDPVLAQYYCAMGFMVTCDVTQGLPAFVYRMELRSGKMVHPTLRQVVHEEIRKFREEHPEVLIDADMDPDDWDVRRGAQTIVEKA